MERTTVCHIITRLEMGGAQGNTLFTVGHLDRMIFAPVLITGAGGILDHEARELEKQGIAVHFIPSLVREIRPLRDLAAFFALKRLLKKIRPDVVHTHSSKAGILGRWAAFFAGAPLIIHTFHGYGFHGFQKPFVRAAYVLAERLTALITARFIVVTAEDIAKGISNGIGRQDRYLVIRSGIDIAKYRDCRIDTASKRQELGIPEEARVISTIGPFKPQKNLLDFVILARDVRQAAENTVFLMIGDGEQRPLIEQRIREYGLEQQVILLSWRRDIPEILKVTDVFVLTSLWEGLPRAILEAMSSGLPVVANAVDGVREIVRDGTTGYLIPPRNVPAMAKQVIRLLNDPGMARQLGERGRDSIDNEYDINYMVQHQEKLYLSLLKDRSERTGP